MSKVCPLSFLLIEDTLDNSRSLNWRNQNCIDFVSRRANGSPNSWLIPWKMTITFLPTYYWNGTLYGALVKYRYSILLNGRATSPTSAVELAVDFHAIRVINAHNFQRCINALWRGYYHIQYYEDSRLIVGPYRYLISRHFRDHFDAQRIKGAI